MVLLQTTRPGMVSFFCIALALLLHFSMAQATQLLPSPISVPAQPNWLGYDGQWSASTIRVGTPPQWVALLPSTAGQETWVIGTSGCDGSDTCRTKRGGLFEANISSTWHNVGPYALGLDPQLGYTGAGSYGFDSIAISEDASVKDQIVSIVNDTQYWLGYLGLGVKGTNFTQENKPTFLSSMTTSQNLSLSYGYTAGAYYQLKKVVSSLTLGGYDRNRFIPNNLTLSLDSDQKPVVTINKITASTKSKSSTISKYWGKDVSPILLDTVDADLFTIDSSTPYLWLPENVCKNFETTLGLTYNETLQLYTYNSTLQHSLLRSAGITFNFTLTDLPGSQNTIMLSIPFDAGDLTLSYGFPGLNMTAYSPDVPYFPLRKAANSTQYTIGRMFLQETYLIVDYQRNNFSISQAVFGTNAIQNTSLVAILPPNAIALTSTSQTPSQSLSTGALIGIAVGATVCVVILAILIGCYLLRRRWRRQSANGKTLPKPRNAFTRWLRNLYTPSDPTPELDSSHGPAYEVDPNTDIKELPSTPLPARELAGPGKYLVDEKYYVSTPTGHNPQVPVELPASTSMPDVYQLAGDISPDERTETSIYSPDCVGKVSPRSTNFTGTSHPSSDRSTMVLSPLTPEGRSMLHLGAPSPLTPDFREADLQTGYLQCLPSPPTDWEREKERGGESGETTWSSVDNQIAPDSAVSSEGRAGEADLPVVEPLRIRRTSPEASPEGGRETRVEQSEGERQVEGRQIQEEEARPKRFSWESE